MHSIAHIEHPKLLVQNIREFLQDNGTVVVVTPNKDWLGLMTNNNYKPDTTVVEHFTAQSLYNLFKGEGYKIDCVGQFGNIKENINERLFIKCRK